MVSESRETEPRLQEQPSPTSNDSVDHQEARTNISIKSEGDTIILHRSQEHTQPATTTEPIVSYRGGSSRNSYSDPKDSDGRFNEAKMASDQKRSNITSSQIPTADMLFLEDFKFEEGDKMEFPPNLIADLKKYFNGPKLEGEVPKCFLKFNGNAKSILKRDGREAYFAIKNTASRPRQARFTWGRYSMNVVQEQNTRVVNNGNAFMVIGKGGGASQNSKSKVRQWNEIGYRVWTPTGIIDSKDSDVVRMIKVVEKTAGEDASEDPMLGKLLSTNISHSQVRQTPGPRASAKAARQSITEYQLDLDSECTPSLTPPSRSKQVQRKRKALTKTSENGAGTESSAKKAKVLNKPKMHAVVNTPQSFRATEVTGGIMTPAPTPPGPVVSLASVPNSGMRARSGFVFKEFIGSPDLSREPATIESCNTLQRLFAQARKAKIITSDYPTLKLVLPANEQPREIFRGDTQDQEYFKNLVAEMVQENADFTIIVIPGDE